MDRPVIYTSEQGRSTDFLFGMRAAMVGLSKLSEAMLGTGTLVVGLGVTPTGPASLTVNVAPGQIYSLQSVDATAYGALAADTTDQVVKQGLLMATQNLSCPAPGTAGFSINYLIQATYQDQDLNNVVLPYFNSANPSQPLNGQNNTGAAQPTERHGVCVVAVKAGAAATTGTQTTPAPDAGYVGLAVVTVANGQATITAPNIAVYSAVPQVSSILKMMQTSSGVVAADSGAANAYVMTLTPAPAALLPGMEVTLDNITATNTGAATLNVNGLGALPIQYPGGASLQAGALVTGQQATVRLNHAGTAWTLEWAGSTLQVAGSGGVVGSARNVKMAVSAASASATLTADEIILATALGGAPVRVGSFNQSINLATTGAGGMDTGSAPTSGFVAIYAIYNPSTKTSALLATNATSAAQGSVYGGANMPAGYAASGLVSVWPTDGTGKLKAGMQVDRQISFPFVLVLNTTTPASSWTPLSLSSCVPLNAKAIGGSLSVANSTTASQQSTLYVASDSGGSGQMYVNYALTSASGGGLVSPFSGLSLGTAQTLYYQSAVTAGTGTFQINVSSYAI